MLTKVLVGGIFVLIFIIAFIMTQLYSPGGIMSRLADADSNRLSVATNVARSGVASCSVVKDMSVAVDNFATSWLPPDEDYLRTHPHENSALARFHLNRVQGLTKLSKDMTIIQKEACVSSNNP